MANSIYEVFSYYYTYKPCEEWKVISNYSPEKPLWDSRSGSKNIQDEPGSSNLTNKQVKLLNSNQKHFQSN